GCYWKQTASASAWLAWTGLSGINAYKLTCTGLYSSMDGDTLALQFGEGSGPTYKTVNYRNALIYAWSAGGPSVSNSTTNKILLAFDSSIGGGSGYVTHMNAAIDL